MLSDLVQYFTKTDLPELINNCDFTTFLGFIHKYTCSDSIKNDIEVAVHSDPDTFIDIYECGFCEEYYLNDIHLGDALLNMRYENNLMTMLLSTVMSTQAFYVHFEDTGIDMLLDNGSYDLKERCRISNLGKFTFNRKVDKFINKFILSNIEGYESMESPGYVDDYSAETIRFIVSYIRFENKSYARKIRKAYAIDSRVTAMFNELKYYMINGEFIMLEEYCIEECGYNGYFDLDIIYCGINALIHDWFHRDKNTTNVETFDFNRCLMEMNYRFEEYANQYSRGDIYYKLMRAHAVPDKEVIL